jgi:hypothetical protein
LNKQFHDGLRIIEQEQNEIKYMPISSLVKNYKEQIEVEKFLSNKT